MWTSRASDNATLKRLHSLCIGELAENEEERPAGRREPAGIRLSHPQHDLIQHFTW